MPRPIRIRRKPSPLPIWLVERTKTKGVVKVTCPRCENHLWLRWVVWLRASEFQTRMCTFCFKTNQLPESR